MKKWFFGSLVVAWILGMAVGCNIAYKPDVDIEHAKIQSQSGNTSQIKGEYNAK